MIDRAGPFYRLYPTASVTTARFEWCYLWFDQWGEQVAIEWILG